MFDDKHKVFQRRKNAKLKIARLIRDFVFLRENQYNSQ